jgi:cell division control protein 7
LVEELEIPGYSNSSSLINMATIRSRNARQPFEIHHDEMEKSMDEEHGEMEDSRVEDGEEMENDGYSESSEESEGVVDVAVQEDMDKFQESFQNIKDRFRLINRIGEGKAIFIHLS